MFQKHSCNFAHFACQLAGLKNLKVKVRFLTKERDIFTRIWLLPFVFVAHPFPSIALRRDDLRGPDQEHIVMLEPARAVGKKGC